MLPLGGANYIIIYCVCLVLTNDLVMWETIFYVSLTFVPAESLFPLLPIPSMYDIRINKIRC